MRAYPGAVLLLPASIAAVPASAGDPPLDPSTQACLDAYQATQELRLDGRLLRARASAMSCAQESCPAAVRSGCTKWLRELIDEQPSLTILAHEGDRDISEAVVYIDGQRASDTLTGRPIEVDPGRHVVKLVRSNRAPLEQTVLVVGGAKNRALSFEYPAPPSKAAPAPSRGGPVGGIVLAGLGVALTGVFAVLAYSGSRDLSRMRETCGVRHICSDADIHAVKTKLATGDAFLAAAVVSASAGIGWTIYHYTGTPKPARAANIRWSILPEATGAVAAVSATF